MSLLSIDTFLFYDSSESVIALAQMWRDIGIVCKYFHNINYGINLTIEYIIYIEDFFAFQPMRR